MQWHSNWNLLLLLLCLLKLRDALSQLSVFALSSVRSLRQCLFIRNCSFSASFLQDALFSAHLNMFLALKAHQFAKLINNLFVAVKCVMRLEAALLATSFSIFSKQFSGRYNGQSKGVDWYATYFASLIRSASTVLLLLWLSLTLKCLDKGYCR